MRALVFGANGYLGRHLVHAAREKGWEIQTTGFQRVAWDEDPAYRCCDMRNTALLQSAFDWDVDFIFIFGGLTGTTDTFEQFSDYIDVNEKALVGILQTMKHFCSRAKVVFPSSRLVYKGQRNTPLKEDAGKEARTIYAVNKLAAENYLQLYQKIFGICYTVFRIGVPYASFVGKGYSYGTIGFFLRHAMRGEDIPIYGDGCQRRTFSHIEDICEQILAAIVQSSSDGLALNVDGGDDFSIREAAELVAARYDVSCRLEPWPDMAFRCESGDTIFDPTAIREITNYHCRYTLDRWLQANGPKAG